MNKTETKSNETKMIVKIEGKEKEYCDKEILWP
jgi:hypothetical protein